MNKDNELKKRLILLVILISCIIGSISFTKTVAYGKEAVDPALLLEKMFTKINGLEDYQCLFIKTERIHGKLQTEEIRYTFKRPKNIRMEWLNPRKGLKVVYDGDKMTVSPNALIRLNVNPHGDWGHLGSNHYIDESDLPNIMSRIAESIKNASGRITLLAEETGTEGNLANIELLANQDQKQLYCQRLLIWIDINQELPCILEFYDNMQQLMERYEFVNFKTNSGITLDFFRL